MDSERTFLQGSLNNQREHVLGILEGLSDDDLRRRVLPSGWSSLGLVQHLTWSVEVFWFQRIIMGQDISHIVTPEMFKTEWDVPNDRSAEDVFTSYRRAIESADAIFERSDLGAPLAYWPEEQWPEWRMTEVRQVVLHVIAETACHAGHLDAVRELIDGKQWIV